MDHTSPLFVWFYQGLDGLGGWVVFAGSGLSAAVWMLADSSRRSLPVRFQRVKMVFAQLLSIPAAVAHFTSLQMSPFQWGSSPYDVAFYLGLIGGLAPPVIALWYAVHYHDKIACPHGHPPYPSRLRRCPHCSFQDMITAHGRSELPPVVDDPHIRINEHWLHAARADGWLVSPQGRRYILFKGENLLGRGHDMQFQFVGDQAVSRRHARIVEREGRYFLMDLGSLYGTRLNDRFLTLHVEEQLRSGDVIGLSEFTHVTFMVGEDIS